MIHYMGNDPVLMMEEINKFYWKALELMPYKVWHTETVNRMRKMCIAELPNISIGTDRNGEPIILVWNHEEIGKLFVWDTFISIVDFTQHDDNKKEKCYVYQPSKKMIYQIRRTILQMIYRKNKQIMKDAIDNYVETKKRLKVYTNNLKACAE